jgi:hypothetical protein
MDKCSSYVDLGLSDGTSVVLVGDESAAHDFIGPNLREISIKCAMNRHELTWPVFRKHTIASGLLSQWLSANEMSALAANLCRLHLLLLSKPQRL